MIFSNKFKLKYIFLIWAIVCISPDVFSQGFKKPDYTLETGMAITAGKQTPFWLLSNQYGLLTSNKYNGWIKAGVHTQLSKKNIDYDYNIEVVNKYSNKNKIYVHQAYIRLKLYFVNIQAGSMEETFGNQDSSLSSGGLLWSGNARPMPKVSIMVPRYTKIPLTFGLLEFKGGISHGWFRDEPFVNKAWLHHKFGYIQFGGSTLPVHIHYGFHHFAQWAGETNYGLHLPQSWNDFVNVFFAKSGGKGAPLPDSLNALGNHIGSRNFGIDIDFHNFKMGLYWQTIFEDGSGKAYRNIKDGLWGLYLHTKDKNKLINGFVYEFINTTDQSGTYNEYWMVDGVKYLNPIPGVEFNEAGGNDDYFNNGIYQFGWTYKDMTIGTPLITSPIILHGDQSDYIRNNKITGHHFGIEGIVKGIVYKVFYTYYLNFGTNFYPISPNKPQHSILLQTYINNKLPWDIDISIKAGIDIGSMYGNNVGLQFSLIKKGSF